MRRTASRRSTSGRRQSLSVRGDGREGRSYDDCIENIDIGGPAMIRAAAKNHAYVAVSSIPPTTPGARRDRATAAATPALRQRWRQGLCPHRGL
jgi:hypothetical protein